VGFTFLQKKKSEKKRKLWVHKVFRAREEEGEFHTSASEIGMLLINFLELGVVTPSGHKLASREHAVTLPPRLCHERAMKLPWP
jgi:hypothetical protein